MKKHLLLVAALTVFRGFSSFAQTTPTVITGLKLWLDASDVNNGGAAPANNATISTWKDKSGLGNDAAIYPGQSGGTYHTGQINGQPVVGFTRNSQTSGSVYYVAGVDIRATTMNAVTIFTVYRQGAHAGDQGLWGDDNGAWDRFYFTSWSSAHGADTGGASLGPQAVPAAVIPGAGTVGVTRLMTAVYNKGVTNGSAIYFNGAKVTSFTDQTDATAAQTTLRIGWDGDDNAYNGDIAEMIVYNRQLTDCEIQQINRYLGGKYGITFSTATISTTDPTTFNEGGRAVLTAAPAGATGYQWLKNGTPISGATASTYTAYTAGDYQVEVTNSCKDTSVATTITVNTMPAPGNALNFDGANDYVDLGNPTALLATNIKTLECWVKFNDLNVSTSAQEILSKSTTGNGIELLLYNGGLGFFCMNSVNGGANISWPVSNLVTGRWYHVAATWDGTNASSMRLYVNGQQVGTLSGTLTTGVTDPGFTFKIGQWSTAGNTRYFNGSIDEARIWSVNRTQSEIQSTMYAPLSLPATGLISYYKFDQGTASGSNTASNYAYDYSGNGRLGTLTNFTLTGSTSNWVESYAMVYAQIAVASNVQANSFTANWTAPVTGTVTNYFLDVSTDPNFGTFLTGYNKRDMGTATSGAVTGLTLGQTYYYRVWPSKTSVANQAGVSASKSVTTANNPLPVKLTSFDASYNNGHVNLAWNTATEQKTDYFEVQRSINGNNYSAIGRINAAGNTTTTNNYSFTDNDPASGINYYRLKMVDADGSAAYSQVKKVDAGILLTDLFQVYPSPAGAVVTVETSSQYNNTDATITDMQGRQLMQFTITSKRQQVDISQLPSGTYMITLYNGHTLKIIKN